MQATIRLLAEDGPWAIRARSLAREVGASTSVVYTAFGGMPGLVQAVADEGFTRLGVAFRAVPGTDDPVQDAAGCALAYRDFARASPHLFDLMFGLSTLGGNGAARRGSASLDDGSPAFLEAFGHLLAIAQRLVDGGRVHPADPIHVAAQLWSFSHGYITLELSGHFDALEQPLQDVLLALGTNIVIGLGDDPERAARSGRAAVEAWLRRS